MLECEIPRFIIYINTSTIEYLTNVILGLKSERKKLRDDKSDLLNQVKQLCISLQEKEKELRTFIRTFEQRIRDSESIAMKNNSDRERERWSLLKTARDEAERSLALAAQLNARDMQLQRTQDQLHEVMVTPYLYSNSISHFCPTFYIRPEDS